MRRDSRANVSAYVRVSVLAALLACGSEPRNGEPDAYVGTWSLAVEAAPGCWSALALRFTVEQDDADASNNGEFMNVIAEWWLASDPATRHALTGNVNWFRNDFGFSLQTGGANPPEFTGFGASPDKLTGTFTDTSGDVAGHLGCAAGATATHVATAVE